jgi:predicted kinase
MTTEQQTIIITRGLPASGKSTWANEIVASNKNWKRINKDDLRAMVHAGVWSRETEHDIIIARNSLIRAFLSSGHNVIVDDTNIEDKHIKDIFHIVAAEFPAVHIEVKDFLVPVDECVFRDGVRTKPVTEKVIRSMAERFNTTPRGLESWKSLYDYKYGIDFHVWDNELPFCIIVDIDGTIAEKGNRSPFDWKSVGKDTPKYDVINIITNLMNGYPIPFLPTLIFMSGRDEECRTETEDWLSAHMPDSYDGSRLLMRSKGDMRKDYIVKRELYENNIRGHYNVRAVFDDRNQVVNMWRKQLGLTVFQVAEGNF